YAFAYIAMFSIPLFATGRLPEKPPLWLGGAAILGLATCVLYSVLSIFPIIEVRDWRLFTAKIVTVLVGTNALGLAIYVAGLRRAGRRYTLTGTEADR